jgi:hypothetical protein
VGLGGFGWVWVGLGWVWVGLGRGWVGLGRGWVGWGGVGWGWVKSMKKIELMTEKDTFLPVKIQSR